MTEPVIHAVDEEFDERNTVLHLSLGVVSTLRRWNRIVRNNSGERAIRPSTEGAASCQPLAIDPPPFALAVLGLLSVSERLFSHLPARNPARSSSNTERLSAMRPDRLPAGTLR